MCLARFSSTPRKACSSSAKRQFSSSGNASNADELHDDTYMNISAVPQPQTFPFLTATGATKAIKVYVATNKQP